VEGIGGAGPWKGEKEGPGGGGGGGWGGCGA
jgi:hypothetical protein